MVGRVKSRAAKKTNLAVSMKKQKKLKRSHPSEETPAPAPSPEIVENVKDIEMSDDNTDALKKPIIKEGKKRRTEMPLKYDYQSRHTTKANKHTNVVHRQPLSKKKFNKLQKAKRRAEKECQSAANKMEA